MPLPAPGLAPGMLLSPTVPGTGWLSALAPTPAGPVAGSDAGRSPGACRAVPSRALILTGDILGGCWRQLCPESQEPGQEEHAAGRGHGAGAGAAPAGPPGRPLSSSQVGLADGRARPSGWLPRAGQGQAPPSRLHNPSIRYLLRWRPTREGEPPADRPGGHAAPCRELAGQERRPAATGSSPAQPRGCRQSGCAGNRPRSVPATALRSSGAPGLAADAQRTGQAGGTSAAAAAHPAPAHAACSAPALAARLKRPPGCLCPRRSPTPQGLPCAAPAATVAPSAQPQPRPVAPAILAASNSLRDVAWIIRQRRLGQ